VQLRRLPLRRVAVEAPPHLSPKFRHRRWKQRPTPRLLVVADVSSRRPLQL
jgi:hypothetical protein